MTISGSGSASGPGPENRLRIIGELQDLAAPRVATSIDRALEDFETFLDHYRARLEEWDDRA